MRYFFLVARLRVDQLHAFGHLPRHDAEERHFAQMRFDGTLEDEQRGRSRAVGRDLAPVRRLESGRLDRTGRYVDDEFHQPLGPYVALARSAEHRDQVALGESQLQTRTQLVLRQYALVEIELHQRLVVLGGRLGQDAVQLGGPFHFRLGDFELLAYAGIALETIHFHQQHVDERVEAGPRIDRILHDDRRDLRSRLQRIERSLPRRLFMVELVDDRDDRLLVPPGIARLNFRSDLEPVLGVEEHHAHVGHPERREQSAAKVVRARRVDDVQLAPHVLGEQDRRIDRAFIKVLHVSVIRERIVVLDASAPVDHPSVESHRLGQRGLARARGAEQDHVLDVVCRVRLHNSISCFRLNFLRFQAVQGALNLRN